MDLAYIKGKVNYIDLIKRDYEVAHGEEDKLYEDFIHYISQSDNKEMAEMAKEVLKTCDIEFPRYCA